MRPVYSARLMLNSWRGHPLGPKLASSRRRDRPNLVQPRLNFQRRGRSRRPNPTTVRLGPPRPDQQRRPRSAVPPMHFPCTIASALPASLAAARSLVAAPSRTRVSNARPHLLLPLRARFPMPPALKLHRETTPFRPPPASSPAAPPKELLPIVHSSAQARQRLLPKGSRRTTTSPLSAPPQSIDFAANRPTCPSLLHRKRSRIGRSTKRPGPLARVHHRSIPQPARPQELPLRKDQRRLSRGRPLRKLSPRPAQ